MKKRILFVFICGGVVFTLLILLVSFILSSFSEPHIPAVEGNTMLNDTSFTELHIPPVVCEMMLNGTSPEIFCKTKGQGTRLENNYEKANVDSDGCLILTLNNGILYAWKNSFFELHVLQCVLGEDRDIGIKVDYSMDFMNYMKNAHTCGFEISDDYSSVIESPEDNSWYFPLIMPACLKMQVFEGKACESIKVEYVEINETGEVIDRIISP